MRNPFLAARQNSTKTVMYDVVFALFPLMVAAGFAFGSKAVWIMVTAVISAVVSDGIFSALFLKKYRAFFDGSAIITGILLAFTLSPLTPLPIVAFGSASAILFGKILWGGLGKNRFNPALVGREFMPSFFPVMSSGAIWATNASVVTGGWKSDENLSQYFLDLIYKPSSALGEYSILLIALGGFFLLVRNRISWHIPFGMLAVFSLCFWIFPDTTDLKFSTGGLLLGSLFMATDMPSSPDHKSGKLYYGAMIGLVSFLLILGGVRFEYLSFSILILNGLTPAINRAFVPTVWGKNLDWKSRTEQTFLLSIGSIGITLAVISLSYYGLTRYAVFTYIVYLIFKFIFSFSKKTSDTI